MHAWRPLMATSLKPSGRRRSPLATSVAPQRPPERFLPLREAVRDLEWECRAKVPPLRSTPGTNSYPAWNLDPLLRFRTPCFDLE